MRTLPVHPHLAFYRKEAKDIVRSYRAQAPASLQRVKASHPRFDDSESSSRRFSLHDAQLIIAREHGFPSWPQFKHQVDFRNLDFSDLDEAFEQFRLAVNTEDVSKLRTLLERNPKLAKRLDEPVFSFDSPAVVHRKRNREMLEVLLDAGADINRKSDWWAGGFGVLDENQELAEWLLSRGARLDAYAASSLGLADELQRLIAENPAVVNSRFGDGQTPLHVAKNVKIVRLLLAAGAEVTIHCLDHNSTPIQYLIHDAEICRLLLGNGAEPDIFLACRLGDLALVQQLVEEDPTWLDCRLREGRFANKEPSAGNIYIWKLMGMETPFHVAHHFGHRDVYQWLVERSSPQQRYVETCWQADREAAEHLLQENPGIQAQLDDIQLRALPNAAWEKRIEAVKLMLELGWDVNLRGDHDSSVLDRAAIRGQAELIPFILSYGPELNPVNEFGGTPLSACLWGKINFRDPNGDYLASLKLLLEAGCLIEHGDSPRGWIEILWYAIRMEQPDTVPLFVPYCRDLNLQDDDGYTALDLALLHGADEAAALLRERGAKTLEELTAIQ